MPVEYSIDPTRHLVVSSVRPVLTSAEVEQFCRELSNDVRFSPSFKQLHEVHKGALSSMHYSEMSTLEMRDPFSKQSLRAIVVYSDDDYGMAHTYELIHGGKFRLCRSVEEARLFLELDQDFIHRLKFRTAAQSESGGPYTNIADSNREPTLVYKLSDDDVFRCSKCKREIASIGSGRCTVVSTVLELVATFQEHVRRYHGPPNETSET
jgi:hypothetical protein